MLSVALNYEEIKKDPQRITKIKPFINKYNWEGINFPSQKHDSKKFQKNNVIIDLNVLYTKKEKIYPAFVPKGNSNLQKQVILLMVLTEKIANGRTPQLRELSQKDNDGFILL